MHDPAIDPATVPAVALRDGGHIPQLGLGVYKVPDDLAADVVADALAAGYRHVDTATLYENERGVGEGLRRSGLPRDDVFVTTKVWHDAHGFDATLRAFDASLERLGLDTVDLYLIHWPAPHLGLFVDTWRALLRLRAEGRARSVGVSNFKAHHLERLREETGELPPINQIEVHPRYVPAETIAYHRANEVVTEAWAPLGRGTVLDDAGLRDAAARLSATPAQAVLRWHLDAGRVVIPKSVHPARVRENLGALRLELDDDARAVIAALDANAPTGRDPDVFPEG